MYTNTFVFFEMLNYVLNFSLIATRGGIVTKNTKEAFKKLAKSLGQTLTTLCV